jgi:hypothetical protein
MTRSFGGVLRPAERSESRVSSRRRAGGGRGAATPIRRCLTETGAHLEGLDTLALAKQETPGFAQEKRHKKARLAQFAAEICGAGLACATQAGDDRLAKKFTAPVTTFADGKDGKIITRCRNLHKTESPQAEVLAEYKIRPAKVKALKQKPDD